jgi:hypothetical protein
MAAHFMIRPTLRLKSLVLQGFDGIPMLKILLLEELLHWLGAAMFLHN